MKKRFFLIALIFTSIFCFANKFNPAKPFVVVLDAGHGGHDPGNRGNGLYEKDIALDIILKTGQILEKDPSIKVIYTRKSDVFVDLFKRGQIANKAKADLFVSVHCNAHNTQAFGTETFVLGLHANSRNFNIAKKENSVILLEDNYQQNYNGFDPNSPESVIGLTITQEEYLEQSLNLASFVQNNFSKQLNRKNRGVKQAGFVVLHQTFMPSVLIETGFLSNKSEGQYLNSVKGKLQMAASISKAISDYKLSVEQSFATNKSNTVAVTPKDTSLDSDAWIENNTDSQKKEIKKKVTTLQKVATKAAPTQYVQVEKFTPSILFRVQIAASKKFINPSPSNFKGLTAIEIMEIDEYFKYFFGKTSNYENAKALRVEAKNMGFEGCFITAFENGAPISLVEGIKKSKSF